MRQGVQRVRQTRNREERSGKNQRPKPSSHHGSAFLDRDLNGGGEHAERGGDQKRENKYQQARGQVDLSRSAEDEESATM